ncbi:MAG TPA: phage baseplate assembly protein V, partial [Longimicrobiaceae bacterium]|nr:phage baseplate assembly protein V [Longimicrobiaceae bacterium]
APDTGKLCMTDTAATVSRLAERGETQFYGKYRGIVVDNADPDQLGRLTLRVPSVLGESDDCVTDWAWPCVPFGGANDQGWFFIPEPGARVWVEFEEGNLDLPIWVGTFWSRPGATEIPLEAQDMVENAPQRRVLKTPSGHVVELSDVSAKEAIRITHMNAKTMLVMDEKGSVIIANEKGSHLFLNADGGEATLVDQHGNNIRMGDGGTTITNNKGTVVDLAGEAVQVIAKNVHIRSETVSLGEGASEPALLGTAFASVFDAHTHPTALGPSGPPIPVPMPLSSPMHPAISKAVKVK